MNLSKVISILLLLAFSVPFTYANSWVKYYSKAYNLNVRSNPSINWKIIWELKKGYTVTEVRKTKSGWKKIILNNWTVWYARDKYLALNENNANKLLWKNWIVNARTVFVRSEPNFNSRAYAIVKKWEKLNILSENIINDYFIKVQVISWKYKGRIWFIGKKYLDVLASTDFYINNNVPKSNNLMINLNYGLKSYKTIDISDDINKTLENIFNVDNNISSNKTEEIDINNIMNDLFNNLPN